MVPIRGGRHLLSDTSPVVIWYTEKNCCLTYSVRSAGRIINKILVIQRKTIAVCSKWVDRKRDITRNVLQRILMGRYHSHIYWLCTVIKSAVMIFNTGIHVIDDNRATLSDSRWLCKRCTECSGCRAGFLLNAKTVFSGVVFPLTEIPIPVRRRLYIDIFILRRPLVFKCGYPSWYYFHMCKQMSVLWHRCISLHMISMYTSRYSAEYRFPIKSTIHL